GKTCPTHRASGRSGLYRPGESESRCVPEAVSGALFFRKELRHGQNWFAARFHQLSREGSANGSGRACRDGTFAGDERRPGWFRDRSLVSEVSKSAGYLERSRSGRLRGLLGARLSAECVSQWNAVSL